MIVYNTVTYPDSSPQVGIKVEARLVASLSDAQKGGFSIDHRSILGSIWTTTDEDGYYEFDLIPNDEIIPDDTFYTIIEWYNPGNKINRHFITVEDMSTPVPQHIMDILVMPPPTIGDPGLGPALTRYFNENPLPITDALPGSAITLQTNSFNDLLSASETNVQLAFDILDNHTHPIPDAGDIATDFTDWSGFLASKENVQTAFDALDAHTHPAPPANAIECDYVDWSNLLQGAATVQDALDNLDAHHHTSTEVTVNNAEFENLLSGKANVQDSLELLDRHGHAATGITASATAFNTLLSSSDDTVQKALNTLDDHTHTFPSPSWTLITEQTLGSTTVAVNITSGFASYKRFRIWIDGNCVDTGNPIVAVGLQLNNRSTSTDYSYAGLERGASALTQYGTLGSYFLLGSLPGHLTNTNRTGSIRAHISGGSASTFSNIRSDYSSMRSNSASATGSFVGIFGGSLLVVGAVSAVKLIPQTGSGFAAGTYIRLEGQL